MRGLDREINRIKEIIAIHEGKHIITEGAETRNMKAAKHYLYDKLGYDEQQAMKFIGTVKTDIPNSRLAKCKFMLGVVRMACDGQLQDGKTIMSLNKCLKYVASEAHVNEYDNDLNGLSVEEIVNRFSCLAQADLENDKADLANRSYNASQSQYKIVKINSFEEAEQYGEYTTWCVTHYEDMYKSYTNNGEGVFYFCLRNGFENEPEEKGEGCPLDSYGLSMIAVSINSDGSVNTITCRWNHDNGGNDNIMTPKELSQIINMNFYDVFKPKAKEEIEKIRQEHEKIRQRKINEAIQYLVENTDKAVEVSPIELDFDPHYGDKDKKNFYAITFNNGEEWFIFNPKDIKTYHKLLIDMPFQDVFYRTYDMIMVEYNDKYNFVSTKGEILSPDLWFDDLDYFHEGYSKVEKDEKYNFINTNGQIISPDLWFDDADDFDKGLAFVQIDGKCNFININGQIISPDLWFDKIEGFHDGYAKVEKDGKYNFINAQGELLSPTWRPIQNTVNEVRYIDASSRYEDSYNKSKPYRNNYMDVYNQKPIRRNDTIRVYHGCTLKTALKAAIQGISGKEWVARTYSYESGMNPIGIFVTTDFNKAKDFSTDNDAQVIMEFSVKGYQLDTPVWNGQETYFGQGSNPQPFKNAKERTIQKREYNNEIEFDNSDNYPEYVKKSWNPAMAARIFMNNEHQALFYGDLNPNMIKRFWVRERKEGSKYISTLDSFVPYTRSQFIHHFKDTEFIENQWYNRDKDEYEYDKRKITKGDKVFMPNEDFTSIDDLAMRIVQREKELFPKSVRNDIEKEKKFCLQGLNYYIKNGDNEALLDYIWPKQLRQLYGEEEFENNYDRLGQLKHYK